MRLVGLELRGYRRFERASCRLEGHIIAVVGPNEAGKTSMLQALQRLEDALPIEPTDRTSNPEQPLSGDRVIGCQFRLDDDDYAAVAHLPRVAEVRWLETYKNSNGSMWNRLVPRPTRDPAPRSDLAKSLARAVTKRWLREADAGEALMEQVHAAIEALGADGELDAKALASLRELGDGLREEAESLGEETDGQAAALRDEVDALVHLEATTHPADEAAAILQRRTPRFAWFGDDQRNLLSEYDISQLDPDRPPGALSNLAQLAGLNLHELKAAFGDMPLRQRLLDEANDRLSVSFRSAWRQSNLTIALYADGSRLLIHAHDDGVGYTSLAERSDGVRAYVALYCFLHADPSDRPAILLVDEADSHLHYEAQADLVRAFTRQTEADVIYTTHSSGCLPEDLGTGIRVVEPVAGRRSVLSNEFWRRAQGFTGLLLAMGAGVLAFTPTRRAVIAEGPTETVLLPTLMREALGVGNLGFQVAPGLSEVSRSGVAALDFEAARVAYVVDGDGGGRDVRRKLLDAGVPKRRVLTIAGKSQSLLTLEDFLSRSVLAFAVNESLRRSGRAFSVRAQDFPRSRRWNWLKQRCASAGIPEPDKMDVANFVVWYGKAPRLSADGRNALTRLHRQLEPLLDLRPTPVGSDT